MSGATAATRRLGVLGWPVAHSRSPAIHGAVHRELGIDASYELLPVPPGDLVAAVAGLRAMGWLGANVTVPHKQAVVACCDVLTPEAELVGAVNTLHFTAGGLVGDNTDARGWSAAMDAEQPGWDGRGSALVLGTGGAARAVVVGLARRGVAVAVAGRRVTAARELADLALAAGAPAAFAVATTDEAALATAVERAAVVVNATPLGMHGERLPEPLMRLRGDQAASDLVYEPARTPFLVAAAAAGAPAVGGLGMLVHQAALASARWHDIEPPVGACLRGAT